MRGPDVQQKKMFEMILGYQVSQTIRAFADLSLADHLADGPLTAADVATRGGSATETTSRLMRTGVSLGLLTIDAEQRFHATALLDTLRKNTPGSLRPVVLGLTNPGCWLPWGEFVASLRKGETQASQALGTDVFEYLRQHPAQADELTAAMEALTALWAPDVARLIDTSDVKLAVDVGGANGALLRQLQQANLSLHGIVFDRPHVVGSVAAEIAAGEFADRTEVVAGDFFETMPSADLYLLKFVLHDWPDPRCAEILSRCREAMLPGGRVVIIEFLLNDVADGGEIPAVTALTDLSMLAIAGGRERSLADFDALLSDAGLRRVNVHSMDSPQSVIEAVAV
jgi:hypothetical protein